MYYLDSKQFLPATLFFSALLVPMITLSAIAFCLYMEISFLVISCVLTLIYTAILLYLWKSSHREEFFLTLKEDYAIIVYNDFLKGKSEMTLSFNQMHTLIYYRITSITGWLLTLDAFSYPKSVCVEYTDGKNSVVCYIGYLDYADVKKIADITNTKLKVY